MPRNPSQRPAQTPLDSRAAMHAWQAIEDHLESVKREILKQIEHYPPPIPACDAQFNYLLEKRDGISQELRILDAVRANSSSPDDRIRATNRFIQSSRFIDAEAAARLFAIADSATSVR